jgi:hypothetical protein
MSVRDVVYTCRLVFFSVRFARHRERVRESERDRDREREREKRVVRDVECVSNEASDGWEAGLQKVWYAPWNTSSKGTQAQKCRDNEHKNVSSVLI